MWLMQNSWLRCYIISTLCFQTSKQAFVPVCVGFCFCPADMETFPLVRAVPGGWDIVTPHTPRNHTIGKANRYDDLTHWLHLRTKVRVQDCVCVYQVCVPFLWQCVCFVGLCTDTARYRREGVQPSAKLRSQYRSEHEFTTTVFIQTELRPPREKHQGGGTVS